MTDDKKQESALQDKEFAVELEHSRIANQNKTDLVSMMAHELRTVISGMKWSISILLDKDLGELTEGQHALLVRMNLANDRNKSIVDDILTLNRTEGSNISYSFQPIDVVELIEEIVFDFTREAEYRGVEVLYTKPIDQIMVQADKLKLRGAIQNLIENAIKYSTHGNQVRVIASTTATDFLLTIADNGIGIPDDQKERVFDKFFRASNAIKKEEAGYGVGLFSVRYIIEKHNGTINFESKEDKGTTFNVSIPLLRS